MGKTSELHLFPLRYGVLGLLSFDVAVVPVLLGQKKHRLLLVACCTVSAHPASGDLLTAVVWDDRLPMPIQLASTADLRQRQ